MGMTPQRFYDEFVVENYKDYLANTGSLRHAFNAVVAASHMADHHFEYSLRHCKKPRFTKIGELIEYLNRETDGAFGNVRSIANVYKHLYSTRVHSDVSSTGAIEVISVEDVNGDVAEVRAEDDNTESSIHFTTRNGVVKALGPVLDSVVQLWSKILAEEQRSSE